MGLRFPVLMFAAALCLSAAAPARAAKPEFPALDVRELIENMASPFKVRRSGKASDELETLRKRLEEKWTSPAKHCALREQVAGLEASRGNFRQAIEDLQAYVDVCKPADARKRQSFKELGQLHLALKPPEFERAIEYLRKSAADGDNPDPDVYLFLGQALAMAGRFDEAEAEARRAIERAAEAREDDYRLLVFCHMMRKDHGKAAALLEKMISMFPVRNEYLGTLGAAYYELGRYRDALVAQAFRYELGLVNTEAELVGLAQMYLADGNPHRAARILDKEIRDGNVRPTAERLKLLADMWSMAREREKARLALAEAADKGRNGELEFRLALTYFEDENWDLAEKYLRRALREGGLMQPCTAHVLLGYTLYYGDDKSGALRQFEGANNAGCREETGRSLRDIAAKISGPRGNLLFRRIAATAADGERARAASRRALDAAGKAVAARRAEVRDQWLAAYEGDRDTARRYLDGGALEAARDDHAAMALLRAGVPADELPPEDLARLRRLDRLARRRVAALEAAQSNLERAAGIAGRARQKELALSGL